MNARTLAAVTFVATCAFRAEGEAQDGAASALQRALDPSCDRAEARQLDFWLGEWDVYDDGSNIAQSVVQRLEGSCSLLESYSQPDGYTGKSINFYDAALRKWRQTWVDRLGTVSEFTGEVRDGAMQLQGETHTVGGRVVSRKMTLSRGANGEVRQYSERSDDGGATWATAYDYIYKRRK